MLQMCKCERSTREKKADKTITKISEHVLPQPISLGSQQYYS